MFYLYRTDQDHDIGQTFWRMYLLLLYQTIYFFQV
ncbi:hypothetical protein ES705_08177 [subsurface metagenome]